MVSFDAAEPGTSVADWNTAPRLHDRPPLRLGPVDEVVVVGAHPDDETLGAGGLIRVCHDAGVPVRIVCVTDGAASHPDDPHVARRRGSELASAVDALAPDAPVSMLGFADGNTHDDRSAIEAALRDVLREVGENALLVAPWTGDGHIDHATVGEVVQEVADGRRVIGYPIWMWHWGSPEHADIPWDDLVTLQVSGAAKERAIGQFTSQISGAQPVLRADFLEHFRQDQELFVSPERALGRRYFDGVYAASEDPWRFRTRWYEERKRDLTIASLPHRRYARALEIGCSIGMLTEMLASRCADLTAVDLAERAVAQARQRVGAGADVRVQDVLVDFPEGTFDLIVLSEVGYYWGRAGLAGALRSIREHLAPDGVLVACHWRHPVDDHPLDGDEVHDMIRMQPWVTMVQHVEEDFLLEVFGDDARSVAAREGFL